MKAVGSQLFGFASYAPSYYPNPVGVSCAWRSSKWGTPKWKDKTTARPVVDERDDTHVKKQIKKDFNKLERAISWEAPTHCS